MSSKLRIKKNYIDELFTFLNVDLKKNQLLDLINLKGTKTIYTPTETTPFLTSIIRKFINNNIVVVLENNEIARKVFQDCQSFLGDKSSIIYIPEIETHPMSGLEKNSISFTERNDALSKVIELNEKPALIITSALSLAQKIPEKNYFYSYGL